MGTEPIRPDYGYKPGDDVGAIEILLQAGANPEARDEEGLTPLLLTARCGRPARVAALLRCNADSHACDAEVRTAAEQVGSHHDAEQAAQIVRILSAAWK
jgi:ankyrin repeat protein